MAERLVTLQDLEKHPELVSQGVSLNQHFDFDAIETLSSGSSIDRASVSEPETPNNEEPKPLVPDKPKANTKDKAKTIKTAPIKKIGKNK